MSVNWNTVFNKIKIVDGRKDFSCYDTQIRNGVDRKTIISKTCDYMLKNPALANEDLEVINLEALFKAVKNAVESFDINGECKLGQHINNTLNMRRSDIIEDDILTSQYKNKTKKYYNFKKDLKKANINWDELSANERVEAAKQLGISELQLRNMLDFQNIINADRLYTVNQDDEEYDKNGIEDKRAEDAITCIEDYEYMYDMFSYIFKNSKEKKHEIFKMIDSNGVRNMDYDPHEFIDFVNMEYIGYADKYKTYKDVDIVSYKYFDGKRSTDKNVSKKEFKSKQANFTETYRKPYNYLGEMYRKND